MLLLSFQETEVAALMQARGWPEWIFTRLATGLPANEALLRLAGPAVLQLVILMAAIGIVGRRSVDRRPCLGEPARRRGGGPVSWGYLLASILCVLVIPGGFVIRGAVSGLSVLSAHPSLLRQIGIALLFGITSGLFAWSFAGWMIRRLERPLGTVIAAALLLPGLLGAWTLGLSLSAIFQTSRLLPLYDTPVPMLLGETLFQVPRAFLVQILLGRLQSSTQLHLAVLLASAPEKTRRRRAADLQWHLDTRGRVIGALIVCYWATMELTIPSPSLLGPPGLTPAPVLLYNQMHYGQIPGLSALVLAALAVPVVCLVGLSLVTRRIPVRLNPSADA